MDQPKWMLTLHCRIVSGMFDYFYDRGMIERALPLGVKWAELSVAIAGEYAPFSANAYSKIADMHYEHGFIEAAETLYKRSLELAQVSMRHDHPELGTTYNNLGAVLAQLDKHEEALVCYEKARVIAESNPGCLDQDVVETISANMASCRQLMGYVQ